VEFIFAEMSYAPRKRHLRNQARQTPEKGRQEKMTWTALIFACWAQTCGVFGSVALPDEQTCLAQIPEGMAMIARDYPQWQIRDFRCINWGDNA